MKAQRILHALRAPVGGLFRHVRDLAIEQSRRGHAVGVLCDATACDSLTAERLERLGEHLDLGVHQTPMARGIGLSDFAAYARTRDLMQALQIDVAHGHGAKGGAYARLAARTLKARGQALTTLYTPHGGSLHFAPGSLEARVFMSLERQLMTMTDGLIFESGFAQARYRERVGGAGIAQRVVFNGVSAAEFVAPATRADASELLFIGELRDLKGVDVLLEALAIVRGSRRARLTVVGEGPDGDKLKAQAADLGLGDGVSFVGAKPAAEAFSLGQNLVVPSRAESLPYVVLEAAAAGLPMIASDVGGIPEIVAGTATELLPAGDPQALARAIEAVLGDRPAAEARAVELKARVRRHFTIETMCDQILAFSDELAPALAA